MDKNKELAELLGICWHEVSGTYPLDPEGTMCCNTCECYVDNINLHSNPDFSTPEGIVSLLGIMHQRGDWDTFHLKLYWSTFVDNYILDTTGKLRDKAIEFLKSQKDKP